MEQRYLGFQNPYLDRDDGFGTLRFINGWRPFSFPVNQTNGKISIGIFKSLRSGY
jgi:hypothetical protein